MFYRGYFKDIDDNKFTVTVNVKDGNNTQGADLMLDDNPVTISWDSPEGLYSPIKSRSCSIRIRSRQGMFNLYTPDPWGIEVTVVKGRPNEAGSVITTLFKGFATPCQYNQSWTFSDVITLECVDIISVLKDIPYTSMSTVKRYKTFPQLVSWVIRQSPLVSFNFHTPMYTILGCNSHGPGGQINDFGDFLEKTYFNEANFFDDDAEQTPWSCYEVLSELCRYLGITLVPWENTWHFIDYCYAANVASGNDYEAMRWDQNGKHWDEVLSKPMILNRAAYVGGQPDLSMDKVANIYNVETNRYDIDEITGSTSDHSKHISITKECNFSESEIGTIWTETKEKFWTSDETVSRWVYKTYCRFNPVGLNWKHSWWIPYNHNLASTYYDSTTESRSSFTILPENKWLNTIGAFPIHYATVDDLENKPTALNWKDCIMFTCMHDTIQTANLPAGKFNLMNYPGSYEKLALQWDSDYEMCFSPKDGTSYLVIDCKLWYQQNLPSENPPIMPVDFKQLTNAMFPIEDVTNHEPYTQTIAKSGHTYKFQRAKNAPYFGTGWELLKMSLQVGNKYWNGSSWTTTASTFGVRFSNRFNEKVDGTETEFDGFRYLDWMTAISTSTYEDGIGKEGYCIPITQNDGLCGQVTVKIYMPRLIAYNDIPSWWQGNDNIDWNLVTFDWYELGANVFMKDFNIDYVYVENKEWYLSAIEDKEDVKYSNETKDQWKIEDTITCKINSWQADRPISKSFPVIDIYGNGKKEYVKTIFNTWDQVFQEQEYNLIAQRKRHYDEPMKIYEANVYRLVEPWSQVTMIAASGLNETGKDNTFVLDKQEYNIRNRNVRATFIEFGNSTMAQS